MMASSNSSEIQNSGSEGDLQVMMLDERKRKRMESNRESARRSRVRKQKHLDDLTAQIERLKRENEQVLEAITVTTQRFIRVEAENSVLRAQMGELRQRLESLNGMVSHLNGVDVASLGFLGNSMPDLDNFDGFNGNLGYMSEPWNFGAYGYLNQPMVAAASDLLQY